MNAQTLLKKIKLEDKCRDFNWINNKFKERKLLLDGTLFNEKTFEYFRIFIKTLQEIYEDSWDIDIQIIDFIDEENYGINILGPVILFKDLEIKNSTGESHKIQDLFVRIELYINDDKVIISGLSGGRTTISYAEWSSGYIHSHLPGSIREGNNPPFWSSFCRGSGHINDFISNINCDGLTSENVTPFLIQILGLVSWESIEGGPHRRISNIKALPSRGRILNPNPNTCRNFYKLLIEYCRDKKIIPNIEFSFENNNYVIVDNEIFTKFVSETTPILETSKKLYFGIKDNNGTYYCYGELPGFKPVPIINNKYIFQGQEVSVNIGASPSLGDFKDAKYEIHPIIKEYIKRELEYDINSKKIRKSTIERYSSGNDNATKNTKPDKMVVQGDS